MLPPARTSAFQSNNLAAGSKAAAASSLGPAARSVPAELRSAIRPPGPRLGVVPETRPAPGLEDLQRLLADDDGRFRLDDLDQDPEAGRIMEVEERFGDVDLEIRVEIALRRLLQHRQPVDRLQF